MLIKLFSVRFYSNKSKYYVTTPIYYVNSAPHIGHLYSSVITDAAQRWQKLLNPSTEIKFATGTDEHGIKVQQAAIKNETSVSTYCDQISAKYKSMSDRFSINYTTFIRTTDEAHINAVQHFWKTIEANGYIYSKKYAGWYCVSDETFLTESQIKEIVTTSGEKIVVSAESGHPVEWAEEQNYMFKLSNFQNDLQYWLTKNEDVVKPKKFQKILLDFITTDTLPDISISRPSSRVHWGIEVPTDKTQTIYVWVDALVNYLTVAGYSFQDDVFKKFWPPDLQVIGKDILKFHGVYWPAFLMAAKLDLPHTLLCHSHWTVDGEKMSKSKNNVVCPFNRSEIYTTDGFRYFLLREGVAHSDGNYSDQKVIRILNSELADTLGNLLSRCTGNALNPNGLFPNFQSSVFHNISHLDVTKNLLEFLKLLPEICENCYSEHNFYKVVDNVIKTLYLANLFFETLKPWELKKDESKRNELDVVLHITLETLRVCSILLTPIIPNISEKLLDKLNIPRNERHFDNTKNLSWYNDEFKSSKLSSEKLILFKRILTDTEKEKRIKMK